MDDAAEPTSGVSMPEDNDNVSRCSGIKLDQECPALGKAEILWARLIETFGIVSGNDRILGRSRGSTEALEAANSNPFPPLVWIAKYLWNKKHAFVHDYGRWRRG